MEKYNYKSTLEIDVLKEPFNFIFFGLLGFAFLCLIILFFSLLFGNSGVASFFGWMGIIAAIADIIFWLLLIFKIIS
tara:strand:- start:84 stop:314 length:231 start_codon:yes stop_codon:yes gene_type:complete